MLMKTGEFLFVQKIILREIAYNKQDNSMKK